MNDRAPGHPGDHYAQALRDLRSARQRYVNAKVPMEPVRRRPQVWMSEQEPPDWTPEQAAAVRAYAHAWQMLLTTYEACRDSPMTSDTDATKPA